MRLVRAAVFLGAPRLATPGTCPPHGAPFGAESRLVTEQSARQASRSVSSCGRSVVRARSSSSRPSALTPNKSSATPPTAITAAPMRNATATRPRSPVLDERPEQQRTGDATDRRSDRIEERDGHCARLHREDLTDGQVRGAGARGREEEAHRQHRDEDSDAAGLGEEQRGETDRHRRGAQVGKGNHRFSADRVEQSRPSSSGPAKLLSAHTMKNSGTVPDATP